MQVIIDTIKDAVDEVPLEMLGYLLDSGICLSGGSSQLANLPEKLNDELKIRVWLAEDPMTCVARGAGLILEDVEKYRKFLVDLDRGNFRQ